MLMPTPRHQTVVQYMCAVVAAKAVRLKSKGVGT